VSSARPESKPEDRLEVAFVCTGNRARSPLAEAFFRRGVEGRPVRIRSFGTLDLGSQPALPLAVAAGASLGVDLSAHHTRPLQRGGLRDADLVIGFEPFHVSAAVVEGGASPQRAFVILDLPGLLAGLSVPRSVSGIERARLVIEQLDENRPVHLRQLASPSLEDPFGRPRRVFLRVAREIEELVARLAAELFPPSLESGFDRSS
jgi:protein-tyrosine-phosphatase